MAMATLALTVTGLVVASPVPAAAGAGAAVACQPTSWRFVNRWNQDPNGYGCATSAEYQTYNNGWGQNFANGQIRTSPMQGTNMVVSIMRYTYWDGSSTQFGVYFGWGLSDPYHYDMWLIRTSLNGVYTGQRECAPGPFLLCTRTSGGQTWAPAALGWHQIMVEGCDQGAWGRTCNQQWTVAVDVWV
ncbi:hypothetical protein GCM10027615_64370 [Plantactinospora veratri]